ncbi:Serine threonine-kinase KIN4 [Cordyceps militaris]|uniref:non-specific serine/threonine protein kinase n=1 Tax=Cordyceps militaris TaxID=73501 RepID=A0A2H4SHS8_CORMI|nr:Serine threonine-kinase KIN4 [Cordyceps militaris]
MAPFWLSIGYPVFRTCEVHPSIHPGASMTMQFAAVFIWRLIDSSPRSRAEPAQHWTALDRVLEGFQRLQHPQQRCGPPPSSSPRKPPLQAQDAQDSPSPPNQLPAPITCPSSASLLLISSANSSRINSTSNRPAALLCIAVADRRPPSFHAQPVFPSADSFHQKHENLTLVSFPWVGLRWLPPLPRNNAAQRVSSPRRTSAASTVMSAALQSSRHQPPPVLTSSPLPPASNRQYMSSHASPTRESYGSLPISPASQSAGRPPSRKTSSGAAAYPNDVTTTLAARPTTNSAFNYNSPQPVPSDPLSTMAPPAPPRTSSSYQNGNSRRYTPEKLTDTSKHVHAEPSRNEHRHADQNGHYDSPKARRSPPSHIAHQDASRQTGSRDGRQQETVIPIRTHQSDTPRRTPEASDTLNRIITNPEENYRVSPSRESAPAPSVPSGTPDDRRRRQEHPRSHRTSKFGDFILGNTIGEGEFGKVKLGWKQDSSVQVAIKLIKRDTVGTNPSRLAKIRREVTILRGLHHPNIVRLFDMVETDRYIGIILEYASGGELFDYILNHRYLKDGSARRLFAQLVSGVGYLHKKGIVHRDLKLENLLLDSNRNIIITDFGFANTFDPHEDLSEEEELNLQDRDQVKRMGLDRVHSNGMRKGDLMQTSCGSPCYAAPELVVSDALYTGRKVDVWSCGVILYAMLAGYLPFDDDPANPEGDNINLLYKYIVTTPLTFPEYVTPHARDLLRRILVPNPRKRADLFEVARHSWLSEYAHIVEFITSSTTSPLDVQNGNNGIDDFETPMMTRSASVREAAKQRSPQHAVGGLSKAHAKIDSPTDVSHRTTKDAKRRTVQVEYVAPTTQTQRGVDEQGRDLAATSYSAPRDKPLPVEPASRDKYGRTGQQKAPPVSINSGKPGDGRTGPDNTYLAGGSSGARPQTGGSMQSTGSMGLQSRVLNYGQPAPPTVENTNAQGRIQQPAHPDDELAGRNNVAVPPKFARVSGFNDSPRPVGEVRGHKRSSTLGDLGNKILGRSGSVFGKKGKRPEPQMAEKKKYPPISIANNMAGEEPGRASMDSKFSGGRRSFSLGLGKKRSGSIAPSQGSEEKKDKRRFSLLPASFSLKAIGLGKGSGDLTPSDAGSRNDLPIQDPRADHARNFTAPGDARGSTPFFDDLPANNTFTQPPTSSSPGHQRYQSAQLDGRPVDAIPTYIRRGSQHRNGSQSPADMRRPPTEPQVGSYRSGLHTPEGYDGRRVGTSGGHPHRGTLQKSNKRFTDAYEQDGFQGHEGSSGAAKRVMDFFRRRGRARGGDE